MEITDFSVFRRLLAPKDANALLLSPDLTIKIAISSSYSTTTVFSIMACPSLIT